MILNFLFHLAVSTTGNFINYDMCNNSASVTCSTFSSENCSMNSMDIGSPVLIKPGDTYLVTLDTNPQNIEITIRSNSTILVQSLNFTVGKYVCQVLLKYFIFVSHVLFILAVPCTYAEVSGFIMIIPQKCDKSFDK